jgi:hypothetical protein
MNVSNKLEGLSLQALSKAGAYPRVEHLAV